MSTPFTKSKLKAARDAIAKKDWPSASQNAQQVLDYEPENYNARVFLALALLEQGQTDQSEAEYRKAIEANSTQPLAWQGLTKFYERVEKWDRYAQTLLALADIFKKSGDATKCAENIQKYIDLRRERGSRKEVVEALNLLIPNSPYYAILSLLPEPDPTNPTATTTFQIQSAIYNSLPIYQELVSLTERDETDRIKNEVDRRRMRLNAAGPEQLRKEVGKEVWLNSTLPALYKEMINHPSTSDELRRETESKLLRHRQAYLYALSNSESDATLKKQLGEEVDELVNGVILLKIPDELAWQLYLDGVDVDDISGYDFTIISHYVELFPSLPMAKLLQAYSSYIGYDDPHEDGEGEEIKAKPAEDKDVLINRILEAYTATSDYVLPNRIAAEIYLGDSDYENTIKVCERGLTVSRTTEANLGKSLAKCKKAFNAILSTSLVHYFPPKHHPRALGIIAEVLTLEPDNIACLMARAYTQQASSQWQQAADGFARVMELVPDSTKDGLQALEEYHWCQLQLSYFDSALEGLQLVLQKLEEDSDRARCLWRIGRCYWEMGEDHNQEEAYKRFIACLKCDNTYAPAFTSLGVYYSDYLVPSDPTRASKCFQKAFELDAREAEAAKRLADGFAEEREWDLVEVIARRTIEGEGGLEGGLKSDKVVPGRYTPTNAWAWKAVGVVELIQKNYPAAIQAFQVALRALPEDDVSWLRLGEAYFKAGRHVAAIKALKKAQELQPDNWLCDYFLGEVQRQLGQFVEAIDSFKTILAIHPTELGALQALSQTYLELGVFDSSQSFVARAESSYLQCIHYALSAITEHTGFRGIAWKNVGDALFHLSCLSSFNDTDSIDSTFSKVYALIASPHSEHLNNLAPKFSYPSRPDVSTSPIAALELAIFAYDHRISLGFSEVVTSASAWYDLGTSIHAWVNKTRPSDETIAQKAISYVKRALQEDPGNDGFWNTYGNFHFTENPRLAQHAYIRAAEIDNKNVVTWTNLGLLYLHHDDMELANEAFYRAQTLDPDYTPAWVGQVLVATAHKHDTDARNLIEHAITLSKIIPEADLEYATRTFYRLKECPADDEATLSSLLTCFFTLNRYCLHRSSDADGLHLLGLVCERMDLLDVAEQSFVRSIELLEAVYEETEDANIERKFAVANVNLARVRLALEDYQGALEGYESAIGLLDGISEEDEGLTVKVPPLLRARAMMGAGQAQFKLDNLQEAIERFEGALELSAEDAALRGQITVLLSQTLWAVGTEEFKESAKTQLLECVTNDPENLAAITALASMGIVSQDDSLVDAALSEILSLPLEQRHALDPAGDVEYLLVQHHLGQGEIKKALVVAQGAVHVEPEKRKHRTRLAKLVLQLSKPEIAQAVLSSVDTFEDGEGVLLKAVADTLCGDRDALRQVQKLVFSRPGDAKNWQVLAFVRGMMTAE